mgnify:CR=1 FL=1
MTDETTDNVATETEDEDEDDGIVSIVEVFEDVTEAVAEKVKQPFNWLIGRKG